MQDLIHQVVPRLKRKQKENTQLTLPEKEINWDCRRESRYVKTVAAEEKRVQYQEDGALTQKYWKEYQSYQRISL